MGGKLESDIHVEQSEDVLIDFGRERPVRSWLEKCLHDMGNDRGLDERSSTALAADILARMVDWPDEVIGHVLNGLYREVDAYVGYLVFFEALDRASPLVTPAVAATLDTITANSTLSLAKWIEGVAGSGEFHVAFHKSPGITDQEAIAWASKLQSLPIAVITVLTEATLSRPFFSILHQLGISNRGLPTDGDFGEPIVELKDPLAEDEDPIASLRRSLWLLHDGRDQPDAVTHAQVEAVIGRIAHQVPVVLRSLAQWAYSFEPDVISTLLVHIGAAELGGPFASQPSVADMYEIALVNFSRGRRDGVGLAQIGICWGLNTEEDAWEHYAEQQEAIGRRVYNEFPVKLRWIIDAILPNEYACLHLLILTGYIELAPDSPAYLPSTYEDED